jgi:hypothetical protein
MERQYPGGSRRLAFPVLLPVASFQLLPTEHQELRGRLGRTIISGPIPGLQQRGLANRRLRQKQEATMTEVEDWADWGMADG